MKRLTLIGDSLPEKTAWPAGRLGATLEPLDPRHSVFAPLVMLPLLAAACHLEGAHREAFLTQAFQDILEEGSGQRHPRRFNTFDRDIREVAWPPAKATVTPEVRELLGAGGAAARPGADLCLTFGYWSISGIIAYLLTGDPTWTEDQLEDFSGLFLKNLLRDIQGDGALRGDFPADLPDATTAQTGIYFKVCTHPDEDAMARLLRHRVKEAMLDDMPSAADKSPAAVDRIVGLIRSMVPLLHIESSRGDSRGGEPTGLSQAVFVTCMPPKQLRLTGPSGELYWKYVGAAIARRLTA